MLARDRRVRRSRDFERIWRTRHIYRHPALVLRVVRSTNGAGRAGFIVAKATAKRAVDRNLLKRRLREIVRAHTLPSGTDLVFVAQRGALSITFAELKHVVSSLLNQALAGPTRRARN